MRIDGMKFLSGIITCIVAVFFMLFIWPFLFKQVFLNLGIVQPLGPMDAEEWSQTFMIHGIIGTGISSLLYILWYLSGAVLRIAVPTGRVLWLAFAVISLLSSIMPALFFKETIQNVWLVYLVYAINGLLAYYISTLLFSPRSLQYCVFLAEQIRDKFEQK